ncbi:hypothetical protein N7530_006828 [Penicillium desertorum]|uniref:Uncharacterized protein n=1 Tax=Penicillium desertorum TaxID=1303715 RepID=A0A9W9WSF8_9EURO|nr:hypothetical protein N7530_006828 [Penicillium desertorum]
MNANLSTSHPDPNPPTWVKINDTATARATTLLKESTQLSDETTGFQPSTSTQRAQMTYLTAFTATPHQQNEVIRLVLQGISHTRKGAVAAQRPLGSKRMTRGLDMPRPTIQIVLCIILHLLWRTGMVLIAIPTRTRANLENRELTGGFGALRCRR